MFPDMAPPTLDYMLCGSRAELQTQAFVEHILSCQQVLGLRCTHCEPASQVAEQRGLAEPADALVVELHAMDDWRSAGRS